MDPIIKIGDEAPKFQLSDLRGRLFSFNDVRGWMVVLNFWSAECVWCERVDHELKSYLDLWKDQVKVLWIASNVNESRDLIERVASERNLPSVLLDSNQQVANLYGAQTTPHFFVIDSRGNLRYQGSWDNVTFRQRVATLVYLPQVIEALRNDLEPKVTQTQPYGCMLVRFSE